MNDKDKTKARVPDFKSLKEETEFWNTHNFSDYTHNPDVPVMLIQTKDGPGGVLTMYAENDTIDDPRLSEMVNVRFDKKTVEELRKLAENDERTMASLIRRFVMQRLKEEKYQLYH